MAIHVRVEEVFDRSVRLPDRLRKADDGTAGVADVVGLLGRERRDPPISLGDRILDETSDDPARQLMDAPRGLEAGILAVDLAEERIEERHLAKVFDGKEA